MIRLFPAASAVLAAAAVVAAPLALSAPAAACPIFEAANINPHFYAGYSRSQIAVLYPYLSGRELDRMAFRIADAESMLVLAAWQKAQSEQLARHD